MAFGDQPAAVDQAMGLLGEFRRDGRGRFNDHEYFLSGHTATMLHGPTTEPRAPSREASQVGDAVVLEHESG